MKTSQIRIRDPFVLPVKGVYYLHGTTCFTQNNDALGFDAYRSPDLQEWEGPFPVFRPEPGFWSDREYWAPEVHVHQGRFFMLASFNDAQNHRGTQILAADSPEGPFRPHSDGPATPRDWMSLDGTLFTDDEGNPWMVFCREWIQVQDGRMCAMRLTPDLKAAAGEPILLFRASEAPWVSGISAPGNFVTDGPFLYRTKRGKLLMLWSSFSNGKYALGIARSSSGKIEGPWVQNKAPLYGNDGGHGMLFRTFDGRLMLSIHSPNGSPNERPLFLPVEDTGHSLRLK